MALRCSLLTKHLDAIAPDALASLDAPLAAALDHWPQSHVLIDLRSGVCASALSR